MTYYKPRNALLDWLRPGLGIHVASVDQGSAEIELGVGVQASLWESLLVVGVGSDLSVGEDPVYYFLGGDLFAWKDKLMGGAK